MGAAEDPWCERLRGEEVGPTHTVWNVGELCLSQPSVSWKPADAAVPLVCGDRNTILFTRVPARLGHTDGSGHGYLHRAPQPHRACKLPKMYGACLEKKVSNNRKLKYKIKINVNYMPANHDNISSS